MTSCDALIVGGGPAGSACAWRLARAGVDVIVLDRATFPRDKTCAGWVTPQVVATLEIDAAEYARSRTFQPITAFRVGVIGGAHDVTVRYAAPVSAGIRRCEFDEFLLRRSGATLRTGEAVRSMRRDGQQWIVNEAIRTPMLIGAGGHFCPVARMISPLDSPTRVVAAQEIEIPRQDVELAESDEPNAVSLYFAPDLTGYGWCFQKRGWVNIGFGQYEGATVPGSVDAFVRFLAARGIASISAASRWRGHAYRLYQDRRQRIVADGVVLIGDAAGLAYSESGEGIRPAVESGLLAAAAIIDANGHYTSAALSPYHTELARRLGPSARTHAGAAGVTLSRMKRGVARRLAPSLLASSWFVRHVLIDRWFLHASEAPLSA